MLNSWRKCAKTERKRRRLAYCEGWAWKAAVLVVRVAGGDALGSKLGKNLLRKEKRERWVRARQIRVAARPVDGERVHRKKRERELRRRRRRRERKRRRGAGPAQGGLAREEHEHPMKRPERKAKEKGRRARKRWSEMASKDNVIISPVPSSSSSSSASSCSSSFCYANARARTLELEMEMEMEWWRRESSTDTVLGRRMCFRSSSSSNGNAMMRMNRERTRDSFPSSRGEETNIRW